MWLFGAKKAVADDAGMIDPTVSSQQPIHVCGQEFMPGDHSAFNTWMAKVKSGNELVQLDGSDTYVPANSAAGKAEIIKAQLQIHGASPEQAQKAVNQLGLVPKEAPQGPPWWAMKSKGAATQANQPTDNPAPPEPAAKAAGKTFRGPQGPVTAK